jgi:hypothetical protein
MCGTTHFVFFIAHCIYRWAKPFSIRFAPRSYQRGERAELGFLETKAAQVYDRLWKRVLQLLMRISSSNHQYFFTLFSAASILDICTLYGDNNQVEYQSRHIHLVVFHATAMVHCPDFSFIQPIVSEIIGHLLNGEPRLLRALQSTVSKTPLVLQRVYEAVMTEDSNDCPGFLRLLFEAISAQRHLIECCAGIVSFYLRKDMFGGLIICFDITAPVLRSKLEKTGTAEPSVDALREEIFDLTTLLFKELFGALERSNPSESVELSDTLAEVHYHPFRFTSSCS